MGRKILTATFAAAALAMILAVAGCGGSDKKSDAGNPTTSAAPDTSGIPSGSSAASGPAFDLDAALIDGPAASILGLTYRGPYDLAEFEQPLCNQDRLAGSGPDGKAASASNDDGTVNLDDSVWTFADEDASRTAYQQAQANVACGTGSFDTGDVKGTFALSPLDLGTTYGDESFAVTGTVTVEDQTQDVTIAGVRKGNAMIVLRYTSERDASSPPEPKQVVQTAAEQLKRAAQG